MFRCFCDSIYFYSKRVKISLGGNPCTVLENTLFLKFSRKIIRDLCEERDKPNRTDSDLSQNTVSTQKGWSQIMEIYHSYYAVINPLLSF